MKELTQRWHLTGKLFFIFILNYLAIFNMNYLEFDGDRLSCYHGRNARIYRLTRAQLEELSEYLFLSIVSIVFYIKCSEIFVKEKTFNFEICS